MRNSIKINVVIPGRALRADPESSSSAQLLWIPGSRAKEARAPE
jgi:hypothetical protein